MKMENRRSYGLSLCTDGQITYVQDGVEYLSSKGSVVILPKGQSYLIRREKTGHFPIINFDCDGVLCDTVTVIKTENAEQLLGLYKKIKTLSSSRSNKTRVFSLFYEMLHLLTEDNLPTVIKKAIKIISEEYGDPSLTNERLAKSCAVSEVYLRKLFNRHLGTSPKQFVIEFRLTRAKELLCESSLSILKISEECGFSSPYHFARIFKEHEGISPTEYGKKNKVYVI